MKFGTNLHCEFFFTSLPNEIRTSVLVGITSKFLVRVPCNKKLRVTGENVIPFNFVHKYFVEKKLLYKAAEFKTLLIVSSVSKNVNTRISLVSGVKIRIDQVNVAI